ncbi:MAG: serine hydrolase, partial [Pelatocladus maniniholoensis HA4357-MV3]|nr:serine hydrolase [Pelatocladus maniniholoensis HA4357-MV3]
MSQVTIKKMWLCGFCISLLAVGCTNTNSSSSEAKNNRQTNIPKEVITSSTNEPSKGELYNRIEEISRTAQGRVGVAATVLETGESVALNGDQRFPMQSVYKFPIGMAVLAQVDQGKLKLEQRIRVEKSDFVSERQHSPIRDEHPQGIELRDFQKIKYTLLIMIIIVRGYRAAPDGSRPIPPKRLQWLTFIV